jgi:hypothetical protein
MKSDSLTLCLYRSPPTLRSTIRQTRDRDNRRPLASTGSDYTYYSSKETLGQSTRRPLPTLRLSICRLAYYAHFTSATRHIKKTQKKEKRRRRRRTLDSVPLFVCPIWHRQPHRLKDRQTKPRASRIPTRPRVSCTLVSGDSGTVVSMRATPSSLAQSSQGRAVREQSSSIQPERSLSLLRLPMQLLPTFMMSHIV